jgi:hypothetical protein
MAPEEALDALRNLEFIVVDQTKKYLGSGV